MKNKYLLPIIFLTTISILFVFLKNLNNSGAGSNTRSDDTNQLTTGINVVKERKYWTERMDKIGLQKTYEDFIKEYLDKNIGDQHNVAHIIGELLYEKGGIKAFVICDGNFSFGCYHSFYSSAIRDKGIDIVKNLDEACVEKFGPIGFGCTHGIGHGILEYLGHQKLAEALKVCEPLTWRGPILGCSGGVFMEYNFPTLIDEKMTIAIVRDLINNDPYEPCMSIDAKFRLSCYYEIPQWWDKIYNNDYKKIGGLCGSLPRNDDKEYCYFGVGFQAVVAGNFEVDKTIEKCMLMPENSGKVICRAGASWGFSTMEQFKNLSSSLCKGLTSDQEKICLDKADLFKDVEKYLKKN